MPNEPIRPPRPNRRLPLDVGVLGQEEPRNRFDEIPPILHNNEQKVNVNFNEYLFTNVVPYNNISNKKMSKKEEEEFNYIRVDLDEAAKKLCALTLPHEDSEEFLELYDKYYEILYKCRK